MYVYVCHVLYISYMYMYTYIYSAHVYMYILWILTYSMYSTNLTWSYWLFPVWVLHIPGTYVNMPLTEVAFPSVEVLVVLMHVVMVHM